ncbi:MAG TPA: ATP-binding protein [Thermoanaerobaculia bacterium]|nr:ATP-binding protein [Thermoanaerobaculia bacterium]
MIQDLQESVSQTLDARREALAEAVTTRHFALHPELGRRYGEIGRARCQEDAHYHLSYLAEAIASSSPSLFADYVSWAKVLLAGLGIPQEDLARNLEVLKDALRGELPHEEAEIATGYVDAGLRQLPQSPPELPTRLLEDAPLAGLSREYLEALLCGDRHTASRLVLDAVSGGVPVKDVYLQVFQPVQHEVGRLWQMNQLTVAQEHYCTAATQLVMSQLYPWIFSGPRNGRTLVAACVAGDLHEIGVRMVSDFFEMDGWNTFYLGANTPTPSVLKTLQERRADVLLVSATITSHVRAVSRLIAEARAAEGDRVKILVGGYPFNVDPDLWQRVGADGCARNAEEAVALATFLTEEGRLRIDNERTNALRAAMKDLSLRIEERAGQGSPDYDELSRLNNELATAQRELARKNAELARLNDQKNQFLGIAAHDLRNPLDVILTYSRFLLEDAGETLDPQHTRFIRTIRSSSSFMLNLVEDLLDVSKIEAGRLELDLARVDLAALVRRNVELHRVLAEKKEIGIDLEEEGGEVPMVLDPAKIEQVLNNLIGNAVKFSPPGRRVLVRLTGQGEGAVIAVHDQGPGIPAHEMDKLFRPFEKTSVRSTGGEKGAGLGLTIVKNIVSGHGGEIRVESTVGEGAAFYVSLPGRPPGWPS